MNMNVDTCLNDMSASLSLGSLCWGTIVLWWIIVISGQIHHWSQDTFVNWKGILRASDHILSTYVIYNIGACACVSCLFIYFQINQNCWVSRLPGNRGSTFLEWTLTPDCNTGLWQAYQTCILTVSQATSKRVFLLFLLQSNPFCAFTPRPSVLSW